MPLVSVVIVLIVVGVLLWCLNQFGAEFIDGKVLRLINILVIVALVLWILSLFIGPSHINDIKVGR